MTERTRGMELTVKLQVFEGPLDLLLYLLEKNKVNIYDIPIVENAERFGLAQLHQLRGRVGRGEYQSYCIFMQGNGAKEISKRLQILNKSNDGFYIAGEDLKLRGPGDLFGIRQSGLLEFKLGDIYQDADILKAASETASEILSLDADLSLPQNEELQRRLSAYMKEDLQNLGL